MERLAGTAEEQFAALQSLVANMEQRMSPQPKTPPKAAPADALDTEHQMLKLQPKSAPAAPAATARKAAPQPKSPLQPPPPWRKRQLDATTSGASGSASGPSSGPALEPPAKAAAGSAAGPALEPPPKATAGSASGPASEPALELTPKAAAGSASGPSGPAPGAKRQRGERGGKRLQWFQGFHQAKQRGEQAVREYCRRNVMPLSTTQQEQTASSPSEPDQ